MAVGLLVQTLYYLVDLYFVARLGGAAIAGVSAAGNAVFVVIALTQILTVGTVALVSHAVGRDDKGDANLVFNQSVALAVVLAGVTLLAVFGLADVYMSSIGADAATVTAGRTYLYWFAPGMALQFAFSALAGALRGTGIVKPTMVVQMLTVLVNVVLAPVLIAGWGTGLPLGVAGAGLASSIAAIVGVVILSGYFTRLEKYVRFDRAQLRPRLVVWRRMLAIGFPAGGEFLMMFIYMAVIYSIIGDFGADAQAGFGLGSRLMQSLFLPAMAIAFAAPAVAGQNFGGQHADRVRQTFRATVMMTSAIMVALTLMCQVNPALLVRAFTSDPEIVAVASGYLRVISWQFVASAMIFTCSGMFQALGNTWPALFSMAVRVVIFAAPAIWLSGRPGFELNDIWLLSIATTAVQAVLSFVLLQWQFSRRLRFEPAPAVSAPATPVP